MSGEVKALERRRNLRLAIEQVDPEENLSKEKRRFIIYTKLLGLALYGYTLNEICKATINHRYFTAKSSVRHRHVIMKALNNIAFIVRDFGTTFEVAEKSMNDSHGITIKLILLDEYRGDMRNFMIKYGHKCYQHKFRDYIKKPNSVITAVAVTSPHQPGGYVYVLDMHYKQFLWSNPCSFCNNRSERLFRVDVGARKLETDLFKVPVCLDHYTSLVNRRMSIEGNHKYMILLEYLTLYYGRIKEYRDNQRSVKIGEDVRKGTHFENLELYEKIYRLKNRLRVTPKKELANILDDLCEEAKGYQLKKKPKN